MPKAKERLYLLDNIRGINLLSMIIYHGMWDLVYLYGKKIEWYNDMEGYIWQQLICSIFILLSGFCWSLGHNQLKRGIEVSIAGLIISAVALIFMPQNRVVFGILTLLGLCMLLMKALYKIFDKVNIYIGFILFVILFICFKDVNNGVFGIKGIFVFELSEKLYANYITTLIGFTHRGFYSTDYFSLLPWFFLFVSGYYLYKIFLDNDLMKYLRGRKITLLSYVGKNTLLIYMIHQPLLYLFFEIIV